MTRDIAKRLETYVGPQTRTATRAILPAVHDLLVIVCLLVVIADVYVFAGLVR
jgi:hypothetical protein